VSDKLKDYKVGESVVVLGYGAGNPAYRAKLLAMGLTKGAIVKVAKIAPLGDPVGVMLKGYELSLRKSEADILVVGRV
jgi:Fe2+ transport system protein FeoA